MRRRYLENLSPYQILEAVRTKKPVFIPVGSLEYHSLHLPLGTDQFHAFSIANELAGRFDGLVFAIPFFGTETYRTQQELQSIGLDSKEKIKGMDFPSAIMKSFYVSPGLFCSVMEELVIYLRETGFEKIVFLNGHAAETQVSILDKIAERNSTRHCKVFNFLLFDPDFTVPCGHAGILETSIMLATCPENVNIKNLPSQGPIHYKDYSITDFGAFNGKGSSDYSVINDPRKAESGIGEKAIKHIVDKISLELKESW